MADGYITIGTELSTDKFDKQIMGLEKKMQKEENKKIVIQAEITAQEQEFQRAIQKTDELADAYQRVKQLQDIISQGKATPGQFTELQGLQNTYGTLEKIDNSFNKALDKQDAIQQKVVNLKNKYEEVGKSVDEYKRKIEGIRLQKHQADVDKIKDSFKGVGNSLKESIRNVGRLALGIFAVRSAYLALRRASSDLASYDQQYAANLEYIRYALTQAIAPVLRWIVQMAMQLLQLINMIVNSLFGINLFANGSAESFRKMKAGAGGVSKAVKEIKKQLLGFDEINMLTDQSDTGTSGGAGGVKMPDFDLSSLEGKRPEWMQWILDHAAEIIAALTGIVGGLVALKAGFTPLQSLGIGVAIAGATYAIEKLLDYIKEPTWKNFGGTLQGIGGALAGIGIAIKSVATGGVGAAFLLYGTIIKYWDKIRNTMQTTIDSIRNNWGALGGYIADVMQGVLDFFDIAISWIRSNFDGIVDFFKHAFRDEWDDAWNAIKRTFTTTWQSILDIFRVFEEFIYNVTLKPVLGDFDEFWAKIRNGAGAAKDAIKWHFNQIKDFFRDVAGRISESFRNLGTSAGNVVAGAFKGVVNGILGAVERILNTPIRAINSLISVINKVPGVSLGTLRTFSLPRLAVGGIVNMPNKGTLVGGALAGESGREGVLPLTDQQAMSELGREIGKNVLVNLTNITTMNGRVIGRELKQVASEQDFAYNK